MAKIEVPKYNESLKSFSSFIDITTIAGIVVTLIGIIVAFSNSLIGFAILYLGTLALSLSLVARFLRKTASIIVEGLGGTIEVDYGFFDLDEFRQSAKEGWSEEELAGLLPKHLYDAWIRRQKPSLNAFAKSNIDSFFAWLENQKTK